MLIDLGRKFKFGNSNSELRKYDNTQGRITAWDAEKRKWKVRMDVDGKI